MTRTLLCAALLAACATAQQRGATVARTPAALDASAITLERIMSDPEWVARSPESPYWSQDSQRVYFRRERAGEDDDERALYELSLASGTLREVPEDELGSVSIDGGVLDAERARRLFSRHGDLFLQDLATFEVRQLTRTRDFERPLGFIGEDLLFERNDLILVRELASGLERELVVLETGDDPDAGEDGDQADERPYLERQQERLLGVIADARAEEERDRERDRRRRALDPTRAPQPIYLGDGWREQDRAVSPTGAHVLLSMTKDGPDRGERDSMPVWITESSWVAPREVRAHVGYQKRAAEQLRLVDVAAGTVLEIDQAELPQIKVDPLAFL
ncbi:MAG: hypothetical protein AAFZ65_19190, partial [Planctomycetota bacterium]